MGYEYKKCHSHAGCNLSGKTEALKIGFYYQPVGTVNKSKFGGKEKQMNQKWWILILVVASSLNGGVTAAGADRPNILYILADDLGYGDLGCYGNPLHDTAHLDALAAGGIRMTDFHAASWCAPSRRALMTGCHANRPWGKKSVKLAEATTIAELFQASGYRTALIGKWHLGMEAGLHPLDQGFDYWYGTRGSNDWDGPRPDYSSFKNAPEEAWKTPVYQNRKKSGILPQSQFTGTYTEEAEKIIREDDSRPFFIYLAHNMPHVPVFASEAFRGKSKNGVYGDVIEELDASVGKLVGALKDSGKLNNTIVVFTSDNGPWIMFREFGGFSGSLRGEKSTTWEGGQRVPCIISWPNKIKPAVSSAFMINYDWYRTFAALGGMKVADGQAIDSLDMSAVLLSGQASPRTVHVFYQHTPLAYRSGQYKIHFYTRDRTRDPLTGRGEPPIKHTPPLLFDLSVDVNEAHNLSHHKPELVEKLTVEFNQAVLAIQSWEKFHPDQGKTN